MEKQGKRTSERIELEVPIEVVGIDCLGVQFFDRTHAVVIGRHGGKLCLERKLAPEQEINIRCMATGLDADAVVVGQIGKADNPYYYGIKFLNDEADIWGIEFPPLTGSEKAAGRVLLECISCKTREVTYLDAFELEVLEANGSLSHACKRCRDVSLWQKCRGGTLDFEPADSGSAAQPPQERRRELRREMRVTACVRTARFGRDLVKTRDVSRNGLCFTSTCHYVPGEEMEVAVPYSPGGGNIFMIARIVRARFQLAEGTGIYGIAYQHLNG